MQNSRDRIPSPKMLIFLTFLCAIPVVWTATCENTNGVEHIVQNGTINFAKIIEIVGKRLEAKKISEKKIVAALGYCRNDASCYLEFKFTNNKTTEMCIITNSRNQHVCVVRTCNCQDIVQNNSNLKISATDLQCTDEIKNMTKELYFKNISCKANKNEEEKLPTIEHQRCTTVKDGIISNKINKDTNTSNLATAQMSRTGFVKGGVPWFASGIACGIITTTVIFHVYKTRERTKSNRSTSIYSNNIAMFGSGVTEEATYSEVTDQTQNFTSTHSSVYVKGYLDPTINGNLETQGDAHFEYKLQPIRMEDNMADTLDLYDHVYNHLHSNCRSQSLLQESVENYSSIHEMNASIHNRQDLETEQKGNSENCPSEAGNHPSKFLHSQESAEKGNGLYLVCIPHVPAASEEKPKEDA